MILFTNTSCIISVQLRRERSAVKLLKLMEAQKVWALRKPILDAHIFALQENIKMLEQEMIRYNKLRKFKRGQKETWFADFW